MMSARTFNVGQYLRNMERRIAENKAWDEAARLQDIWEASPHQRFRAELSKELDNFNVNSWSMNEDALLAEFVRVNTLTVRSDDHHYLMLNRVYVWKEYREQGLLHNLLSIMANAATTTGCSVLFVSNPFILTEPTKKEDRRKHFSNDEGLDYPDEFREPQRRMDERLLRQGFRRILMHDHSFMRARDSIFMLIPDTADPQFVERIRRRFA